MAVWESILVNLLGWSRDEALQWVRDADERHDLRDNDSMVYHEPPAYWMVEPMIYHHFPEGVSTKVYLALEREIKEALSIYKRNFITDTDWMQLKSKLESIVTPYKGSAPRTVKPRLAASV
jgi:hypothetical protein